MARKRQSRSRVWLPAVLALGCADTPAEEPAAVDDALDGTSGTSAWSYRIAGGNLQKAVGVAAGPASDVYVTGTTAHDLWYRGVEVATFDDGAHGTYLWRVDPDGHLTWSRSGPGWTYPLAIGSNAGGDVAIAGMGGLTADFGCGPMSAAGDHALWFASFDRDGGCRASRMFGDLQPASENLSVTVLPDGAVVIAGAFWGRIELDGTVLDSPDFETPFALAFEPDGALRWSKIFPTADGADYTIGFINDAGADAAGQAYLFGQLWRTADVDGRIVAPPFGTSSAWLTVIAADGTVVRSEAHGDYADGLAIDVAPDGTVVIAGQLGRSLEWGGKRVSTTGSNPDAFVFKLDPTGTAVWSRRLKGTARTLRVADVSIDVNGFVGVAGNWVGGILEIDPVALGDATTVPRAFAARFGAASGMLMWTSVSEASDENGSWLAARDMAATSNRRLVVAGDFSGAARIGDRWLFANQGDGFIVRIFP